MHEEIPDVFLLSGRQSSRISFCLKASSKAMTRSVLHTVPFPIKVIVEIFTRVPTAPIPPDPISMAITIPIPIGERIRPLHFSATLQMHRRKLSRRSA